MSWPAGAVSTANVDADTDSPQNARPDILDALQKLNLIIAHVTAYAQTLIDDTDATAARATLGLLALAVKNTIATADIDNDAVTYAKLQNISATDRLLGRSTAGAGDTEEIVCTASGRALIDDASAAAQRTTLDVPSNADLALKAPLASPTFTGTPLETMGTGSGTAPLIGKAHLNTTAVGNVGTGTDDLMTYSLPADSLSTIGKGIRVTAWGKTANNANAKTLIILFGAGGSTQSLTVNQLSTWFVQMLVFATGVNTQDKVIYLTETTGTLSTTNKSGATNPGSSEVTSGAITVKLQGQATADNDIVQEGMLVEYIG
jgi:hypothetical protein